MEFAQTLSQRQTMQMGRQMLQSLAILGMSSSDLSDYLAERAQANPYVDYAPPSALAARGAEDFDALASVASDRPSLMAHVADQIEQAFSAPADHMIALRFAEALEPSGWLGQTVETVALQAGVPIARAEGILKVLQEFEPAGLFARDLADCMRIQAREADVLTWELETLIDNLDMLTQNRHAELADLCDCDLSDLPEIVAQLRAFSPKPGMAFDHTPAPVFPPDLIATKTDEGWVVELNRATSATITVRDERMEDGTLDEDAAADRRRALNEARELAQALERRGDTLLRSAAVLVARQGAFLDGGPAYLEPLSLEDVAAEVGLHASTVSRALSGRMIQTPTRALPLRAFFARAVKATGGGAAVSRDRALNFVQEVISAEDRSNPLSDDQIVTLARSSGLRIARRTVAKYRVALGLGSSYDRRRKAIAAEA